MLVLRRVLDQFCEQNNVSLADPLAIAAAQELVRLWQAGDHAEEEFTSCLSSMATSRAAGAASKRLELH